MSDNGQVSGVNFQRLTAPAVSGRDGGEGIR
jgi:hypothetical protein